MGKPAFLVRLIGRNLNTTEDGRPVLYGFATTRFVRAATAEEAAEQSLRAVIVDCDRLTRDGAPRPEVYVHRVDALPEDYAGRRPTTGFTFFEEECQ